MLRTNLLGLCAAALLSATASAQFCTDNLYHCYLVDVAGTPRPSAPDPFGVSVYSFDDEEVYLAFDPDLPSGTYYVHLIDAVADGLDEVLSTNDPLDRFVAVTNTAGVITLSLPFSSNPQAALFGAGLDGQGQSLKLQFRQSVFTPCRFAVVIGDAWDLTNGPDNPYLIPGGLHPTTGGCAVRSYSGFTISSGTGSNVAGELFLDADRDGVRDPGEGPIEGREVRLVTGTTSVSTTTGGNGSFLFLNVEAGSYTVEVANAPGYVTTTAASVAIEACNCAEVRVPAFGAAEEMLPCDAKPVCYWYSYNGSQKAQQFGVLPALPALHLVNTCGQYVSPATLLHFRAYLVFSNAWNMGYELSAELLAMHCNVVTGGVHPDCVLNDPVLGSMTVASLMQQAILNLAERPYTPLWSPHRAAQTRLKNALQRANNNLIWQ